MAANEGNETMSTNEQDMYFGDCPHCGGNAGYFNAGRDHWFYCDKHHVRWYVGSNLFTAWRDETDAERDSAWAERGWHEDVTYHARADAVASDEVLNLPTEGYFSGPMDEARYLGEMVAAQDNKQVETGCIGPAELRRIGYANARMDDIGLSAGQAAFGAFAEGYDATIDYSLNTDWRHENS